MPTYSEQMQRLWREYEAAEMPVPATARQVAEWAISQGKWQPRPEDIVTRCAEDLARALREEYRTDKRGLRYRAKHAVRITSAGVQMTLWADIDTAPRRHMERAFGQRRKQIVGDSHQLWVDVDVYNAAHSDEPPIQLILDFTDDVAEIVALEDRSAGAA